MTYSQSEKKEFNKIIWNPKSNSKYSKQNEVKKLQSMRQYFT